MELESSKLEYKKEFSSSLIKTIIAFANGDGGKIIIGVDDELNVVGVNDIDDVMCQVTNTIKDSIRPDVLQFIQCHMTLLNKKHVVEIEVKSGSLKPYYLTKKGLKSEGVFIRVGASSIPASENVVLNMIRENAKDSYEELVSFDQDLTFNYSKEFFAKNKYGLEETQIQTLCFKNNEGKYTNLGYLFSDECKHSVKLAVFKGTTKEKFINRVEFSGSVLKQIEDCYQYIKRYNSLNSKVEGLIRTDTFDYPEVSIREALLNCITHKDYALSSSVLISIFDDRIEMLNVGGLLAGINESDILLGLSSLRNKKLANVLYRLKLIEAYGTGITNILNSYKGNVKAPIINISDNAFKITLYNLNYVNNINCYLSKQEKIIIESFEDKGFFTRQMIEDLLNISRVMSSNYIQSLIDKGKVLKTGNGKNIRYQIK